LIQLHDKQFKPFINEATIQKRIKELATIIEQDYNGRNPVFVVMLKGAFLFAADLLKNYNTNCEIIFARTSSYAGTASTGKVKVLMNILEDIENRDIIVIEDIVDSGKTLHDFLPALEEKNPASIKIISLLFKPASLKYPHKPDYFGFEISNEFVVGYGLDYNELGRNLPEIYQVQ
jgi:hypoxanthine phosphoribosyltransferase